MQVFQPRVASAFGRAFATHAIREFDGKKIVATWLNKQCPEVKWENKFVQVGPDSDLAEVLKANPWLGEQKLVVKLDQLVKRRGKNKLLNVGCTWEEACKWIEERRNKEWEVQNVKAKLTHFFIEPFLPHDPKDEYYVAVRAVREGDEIMFYNQGGINVGDVDAKATRYTIPIGTYLSEATATEKLLQQVPEERRPALAKFISKLFQCYSDLHFTYLEINPILCQADGTLVPLDMAAKLDGDAAFFVGKHWMDVEFPPSFGRQDYPEERYVKELDATTGASLKLTLLNPKGRIWTLVAGGGASVLYADTVADLGFGKELGNYGEYSGDPSETLTYEYAKTVIKCMCKHKDPRGKVLIIGGGVANFTDVAATFKGIVRALEDNKDKLREHNVKIFVRRGGPNWQEGLMMMKACGDRLGLSLQCYGPDTYITSVVPLALGQPIAKGNLGEQNFGAVKGLQVLGQGKPKMQDVSKVVERPCDLFTPKTKAIIYGNQTNACQHMLNFDFLCGRTPSVACLINPTGVNEYGKFFYGTQEILIPILNSLDEAMKRFPNVSTCVNFASQRSVPASMRDLFKYPQLKSISIIAEGVPERDTRRIFAEAKKRGVVIIGPATVGGIKPGSFRIGNSAGSLDNVVSSRLYRPGSVAYVSRSGGLSNELNNIVSRYSDGVYEGIAIGGDSYPGSTFLEHLLRYEANPDVKMMVVLGELGGRLEYEVVEAKKKGLLTKPIVAWVMGTVSKLFPYSVQFGHAGAQAGGNAETADAKNKALRAAGIVVPDSFENFGVAIQGEYNKLVQAGVIKPKVEVPPPAMPVDYAWAQKLNLIRKPTNFICGISDERGSEAVYNGIPISKCLEMNVGIGGVIGLLWFQKKLPDYANQFLEIVLQTVADHGPAVSGAHNTIVAARAGKDLISSLVSGLLCIGPRFGGAIDGAAQQFSFAVDKKMTPEQFVKYMANQKTNVQGIGHKIKSLRNPDMRCEIVKKFVYANFPKHDILDFALKVQDITTRKKDTLILNVDGTIGVCMVDMLRSCGCFTREEADFYVNSGCLNGLFVLGRSMGFIGHFLDQKRMKQPLYRHPMDDILYDHSSYIKADAFAKKTVA